MKVEELKLGQIVEDVITGYRGTAISVTTWLNGCVRVQVQAKGIHDGKALEPHICDIEQITLIEQAAPVTVKPSGGDRPSISRAPDPR